MNFLDPEKALRQFGLYGTLHAADLGAGSGFFTLEAARRLDGGRLYAVDIEKDMLSRLVSEAKRLGHSNVHPIWGDLSKSRGVPLADATLDRAIAVNVLWVMDDREQFIEEIKRLLKPGGKVLVIDWQGDHDAGPKKSHKISPEIACALFEKCGFKKESDIDAGDYHYGMIFSI